MVQKMDNQLFNLEEFHKSTTKEFEATKNRVRNLIGDSNWGDEGRYKEAILHNVIKRFLPKNLCIGTGFIVKASDKKYVCSNQVDIIIFDSQYPILFSEGDFVIVSPSSVKAVIEVKTNIKNQNLEKTLIKANILGEFIGNRNIFNGVFSFDGYEAEVSQSHISTKIKNSCKRMTFVNHLTLNKNTFIKLWSTKNLFSVYNLQELSFSFFISNLLYHVTDNSILNDSELWFPMNKENKKLFDIHLDEV